jgi:THO complex subunit 2
MDSKIPFENELSFEEEYERAKLTAVDYELGELGEFRNSISDACLNAYKSRRSVQGFIKFASALIKDEEGYFKQYNIKADQLFVNSLRSQDIDLEILREEQKKDSETIILLEKQTENLSGMINGLVVK